MTKRIANKNKQQTTTKIWKIKQQTTTNNDKHIENKQNQ